MARETDVGVLCKKDGNFYYLEYGPAYLGHAAVERLIGILMARNVIGQEFSDDEAPTPSYRIITVREARSQDFPMEPVYISAHVRENANQEGLRTQEQKGKWGRKNAE